MTQRLDVQADRKTLVWNSNVDECGPQHTVEHRVRMVKRRCLAREPVEKLLVLVKRGEGRPLTPQDIDIAREPRRSVLRNLVKFEAKPFKLFPFRFGVQRPRIALRREDDRSGCIQGAERVHQGRVKLGLRQMVEIVRIFTQIDEMAVGIGRIGPGDDQYRIVRGAFNGPLAEHLFILAGEI